MKTYPKGYKEDGTPEFYTIKVYHRNCNGDVEIKIKSGMRRDEGLRKATCPKCGCRLKKRWYEF